MKISRVGVDLAKNVFQIHGVDGHVFQPGVPGGARIARGDEYRLHVGRLGHLPGERVLAPAATDDQDFHVGFPEKQGL